MQQEKKSVCNTCGGSGEIGSFKGESRFLLTMEECPACSGLGYFLPDSKQEEEKMGSKSQQNKKPR